MAYFPNFAPTLKFICDWNQNSEQLFTKNDILQTEPLKTEGVDSKKGQNLAKVLNELLDRVYSVTLESVTEIKKTQQTYQEHLTRIEQLQVITKLWNLSKPKFAILYSQIKQSESTTRFKITRDYNKSEALQSSLEKLQISEWFPVKVDFEGHVGLTSEFVIPKTTLHYPDKKQIRYYHIFQSQNGFYDKTILFGIIHFKITCKKEKETIGYKTESIKSESNSSLYLEVNVICDQHNFLQSSTAIKLIDQVIQQVQPSEVCYSPDQTIRSIYGGKVIRDPNPYLN